MRKVAALVKGLRGLENPVPAGNFAGTESGLEVSPVGHPMALLPVVARRYVHGGDPYRDRSAPDRATRGFDEMIHTGAFHARLRSAVQTRGLSLERIRDRLAEQGVTVSVSTLSNWQRGASRPGGDTRRVVAALESVLHVEDGALARLLGDGSQAGRRRFLGPGTSIDRIRALRAELKASEHEVSVVAVADEAMVAEHNRIRLMHSRLVVRASRQGAHRHVVFVHANHRVLPVFRSTKGCEVGRTAVDAEAGLIAAELRFGPLMRGETYPIEYQVEWTERDAYYGRWIRTTDVRYELTVWFEPSSSVRSAHRIWRSDARSPHKDVYEVRLVGDNVAHMIDDDPNPGFHGIRWM
jgi:hypothetical protein